jgi:hypothetical protein
MRYTDLTNGKHVVFGKKFYPERPRKEDTYNLWAAGEKEVEFLLQEFGEKDTKTIMDVVNECYEYIFDGSPNLPEEKVIELTNYECSYLHIVRDKDHSVFIAVTIDEAVFMVLTGWKTGFKDKLSKTFDKFYEDLTSFEED